MLFIRLDMNGQWKGIEHRSCFAGSSLVDADEDIIWEKGISCYSLEYAEDALESLFRYWTEVACVSTEEFKRFQVTIFEGYKVEGQGSDWEDLAICTKTVKEFPAYELMSRIDDLKDELRFRDITKVEYEEAFKKLVKEAIS